jgi:hypothetical protein
MTPKHNNGQILVEVVLAIAIFSLVGTATAVMALGGFNALSQGGEQTEAEALAQEGIEATIAIRNRAWNENIYNTSAVAINAGEWVFQGEGTAETIGQYTRTISFEDVCRDGSDEIVPCPGSYTDVHSKRAIVTVDWEVRPGITNTVRKEAYITNWDSREWTEDLTIDFADGTFIDTESSSTAGDGDGAITLEETL